MRRLVDDAAHLGRLIRAARVLRGWRQEDLAAEARVNRRTIIRAEQGAELLPTTRTAIAGALGVDLRGVP